MIPLTPAIPLEIPEVSLRKRSVKLPNELTPALAYFVGILCDGSLNKSQRSHKEHFIILFQKYYLEKLEKFSQVERIMYGKSIQNHSSSLFLKCLNILKVFTKPLGVSQKLLEMHL